jgi:hypothetical protein
MRGVITQRVTLTVGAPPSGRATQPQLANGRRDTGARGANCGQNVGPF